MWQNRGDAHPRSVHRSLDGRRVFGIAPACAHECHTRGAGADRNTSRARSANQQAAKEPTNPLRAISMRSSAAVTSASWSRQAARISKPLTGRHRGRAVDAGVALAERLTEEAKREITPVFIETREDQLIPSLLAGKGDVAANLLLTFTRDEQVAFAPPIKTGYPRAGRHRRGQAAGQPRGRRRPHDPRAQGQRSSRQPDPSQRTTDRRSIAGRPRSSADEQDEDRRGAPRFGECRPHSRDHRRRLHLRPLEGRPSPSSPTPIAMSRSARMACSPGSRARTRRSCSSLAQGLLFRRTS